MIWTLLLNPAHIFFRSCSRVKLKSCLLKNFLIPHQWNVDKLHKLELGSDHRGGVKEKKNVLASSKLISTLLEE